MEQRVASVSWLEIFSFKQTWAFIIGKFLTDPVWWFYLFWLPAFLKAQYRNSGTASALPIALVYTMTTFGSIGGGYRLLYFIKRDMPVFKARKTSMLIYALCAMPVVLAQWLGGFNMWYAVLIIGFAAPAHQAWSANIFTTASDMFPKISGGVCNRNGRYGRGDRRYSYSMGCRPSFDHFKALGSIESGYYIMFFVCGSIYIISWLIMNYLAPKLRMEEDNSFIAAIQKWQ